MGEDTLLYRDGDKDYIEMETKGARPGLGLWDGVGAVHFVHG